MDTRRPLRLSHVRRSPALPVVFALAVGMTLLAAHAPSAHAQLMYNDGATIVTKVSSFMQINGAFENHTVSTFTGSIDDSGTVTITTDFTNDVNAITSNSGLYNIGGNYTNNGTFNRKTGTVNLYGSSNQNVGGTVITTFYDLQFTGGGSKTLTQKEIVDSNCYFNNGVCYTTQTNVLNFTVNGNWINISGMPVAACASYVDGPCEKDMNSTNLFWFPVGKQGRANTCAITPNTATATTYRTQYFDTSFRDIKDYQAPLLGVSGRQYWYGDITTPNPGGADAKIRLWWIPGDYSISEMPTPSSLVVARWDTLAPPSPTPAWVTAGESSMMVGATYNFGWVESALVTAVKYGTNIINRPFTLSTTTADNSLPVEMGPFTVRQVANHVVLDWRTYSEIESLGFELERRTENIAPTTIASFENDTALQAKSPWGASYQTIDNKLPGGGRYTYDLYQIDKDGIRAHVGTQSIDFNEISIPSSLGISVHPNPTSEKASVDIQVPQDAPVSLDLFDVTGRHADHIDEGTWSAGPHTASIDLSRLAAGAYSLVVIAGDERVTRTIVVIR